MSSTETVSESPESPELQGDPARPAPGVADGAEPPVEAPEAAPSAEAAAPATTVATTAPSEASAGASEREEASAPAEAESLVDELGQTPAGAGVIPGARPPSDKPRSPGADLMVQFVIFPFVIVVSIVLVFGFFNWVFNDDRSYEQFLNEIRGGWTTRSWRACYELQFKLTDKTDPIIKTASVSETLVAFNQTAQLEDKRVHATMAIILCYLAERLDDIEMPASEREPARADIEKALLAACLEAHKETRLNALFALGRLKSKAAVPLMIQRIREREELTDAEDRRAFLKVLSYSLGQIADPAAREPLAELLMETSDDVRWNAALALAQLKDARALPSLRAMLDRRNLQRIEGMRADGIRNTMINAMRAVRVMGAREVLPEIEKLSKSDEDFKVRQAALEIIQAFQS